MPEATIPEFQELREVVAAASFLEGEARRAYLDEFCSHDTALRAEAEELLLALDRDSLLETPVPGMAAAFADSFGDAHRSLPDRIGPYRIVGVIGSGGMGTVLEAEEDEPRRRVAVKVLRRGLAGSEAFARFRHEASVLARLRHPGIAQVYATGVQASGAGLGAETPWFAMEFVEGARTLLEYARDEELQRKQRLRLFLRVAEAVQHGHQKGVVHRDLKPENILVDGDGNPKVIDFGVARASDPLLEDATRFTRAGQLLGTLSYMSPEQFTELDVDTRSDVYSLGVCLYELLTGSLPLDLAGEALPLIAKRVQDEAPIRSRQLSGDLETVVFKALEKDRERRYQTVAAFADDVRRVLDSEPVEARAPSAAYSLLMFARRNRALVGAVGIVFLGALAAAGISLYFALEARRAEQDTRGLFDALLERSTEMTSGISDELVALSGGVGVGRKLIRTTIDDLEGLEALSDGDPLVQRRLAEAWYRLGLFEARAEGQALESSERALEALRRSEEVARALLVSLPADRDLRMLLASCALERFTIQSRALDLDEALASVNVARDLLIALREEDPDDVEALIQLAYSYDAEAVLHGQKRDFDAVREAVISTLELFAAAAELQPGSTLHDLRRAGALVTLGGSYYSEARHAEAAEAYERAVALLDPVVQADPTSLPHRALLGRALLWSGEALFGLGDFGEARRTLLASMGVYRALHEEDPVDPQHEVSIVHLANSLGVVERDDPEGDLERAALWFLEALDVFGTLEDEGRLAPAYASFRTKVQAGLDSVEARLLEE